MTFNDFIGKENLGREFKEFTFQNSGLLIDNHLAESYCQSAQFDFNKNVIRNLKRYFRYYLPKYTCAFLNANIKGELYIGVNDFGFIKGIPFQGELPTKTLRQKIWDTISESITNSSDTKFNIDELVSVEVVKIDPPAKPTKPVLDVFTNYLKTKEIFMKEYNKFVEKMENWKIRFNFFTQKLIDLVNNEESRMMLIEYIRRIDSTSEIIKILESDYQLEYRDHEEINLLKEDPCNLYYWVCRWKDEMVDKMKLNKPIFEAPEFYPATPMNLIVGASEMIPYWMSNNSNMNLYVIHIKFNTLMEIYGMQTTSQFYFSYKSMDNKNWVSCYRNLLSNGEPVCTPY
jgi:hypothetical protein